MRSLGFRISSNKVTGPAQKMQLLGINIDTTKREISLRKEKLDDLHKKLSQFIKRCRAYTKPLLDLNWTVHGQISLRRILDIFKFHKRNKDKIKHSHACI